MPMSRWWLLGALALGTSGCETVREVLEDPPELPAASLARVDLVKSPTVDELLAFSCYDYTDDDLCSAFFGAKPQKKEMQFGFDMVFDLTNPNTVIAIPLIELLLQTVVYEDQHVGALCVSFCDPEAESCDPAATPEDACKVGDSEEVDGIEDVVPTIDDLLDLAGDVLDGTIDENFTWRTIPAYTEQMCHDPVEACVEQEVDGAPHMCCGETCEPLAVGCAVGEGENGDTCALCDGHVEAHIAFDLDIDAMLSILETLLEDAVDAFLAGDPVALVIPYTVDGTLFFDIPKLGREALGFGPFEDEWKVVE